MSSTSMIDQVRYRNWAIVAVLATMAVSVFATIAPSSLLNLYQRTNIMSFSYLALIFSAIVLLGVWSTTERLIRLRSGVGVLAQWSIDGALLARFRRHSNEWDKREGVSPNRVDLAQDPGKNGMQVVVTGEGIAVGAHFWPLQKDVSITAYADWIEFILIIPPSYRRKYLALRLPLEPGKESFGRDIVHAYTRARQAVKPGIFSWICILLLIVLGVLMLLLFILLLLLAIAIAIA